MTDHNKPLNKMELHGYKVNVNLFSEKLRVKLLKEVSIARLEFYYAHSMVRRKRTSKTLRRKYGKFKV